MRMLEGVRHPPTTVTRETSVADAAALMNSTGVGSLVVTEEGRAVGIVTDRDLTVRALAHRLDPDTPIEQVMSADLVTLPDGAGASEAYTVFRTRAIRRLPLVDDEGKMVGMISLDDLLGRVIADLADLSRPITGQVFFARPETSPDS